MLVRFFDWDQPKNVSCGIKDVQEGDFVVVQHEWGILLAKAMISCKAMDSGEQVGSVLRRASSQDREIAMNNGRREKEYMKLAKEGVRDLKLPMKVVDATLTLDTSCLVIAFVADGRVDFRELVRKLSVLTEKSIRLQQIGSRDEARRVGGYGICGREICCKNFPGSLKSISTDMARSQLICHRGSERISGSCGRLMCCLAFESQQYQEAIKNSPSRGQYVKMGDKKGKVLDVNFLSDKIKIELEDKTIVFASGKEIQY